MFGFFSVKRLCFKRLWGESASPSRRLRALASVAGAMGFPGLPGTPKNPVFLGQVPFAVF